MSLFESTNVYLKEIGNQTKGQKKRPQGRGRSLKHEGTLEFYLLTVPVGLVAAALLFMV